MVHPVTAIAAPQAHRERARAVRAGVTVEIVTILWMVVEAAVAIGAGVLARSVLLTAFGLDSVIELVTGGVLLWRLATEARGGSLERVARAETRAAWITGSGLILLCLYVVASAALGLLTHTRAEASAVGIGLSVVDACRYVYICRHCGVTLRPRPGDCCVFCSYGTVPCPPRQAAS